MSEGRRRARNSERLLVHICLEEKPLVSEACPTQNLNSLGARLITERSWSPNSRVVVKSSNGDLWARARVVYCQPLTRKAFAVGLEFFVLTGELFMRIEGCESLGVGLTIEGGMQYKSEDRVRRIGQNEVATVKDIREPNEYVVRLNPFAEAMYWIQLGKDSDSCVWVKESELELVE